MNVGEGDDRTWVGWMPSPIDGHEFEHALGVLIGKPVCCNAWGHKDSDMTERLNWNEGMYIYNIGGNLTKQIFSIESRGKDYNF